MERCLRCFVQGLCLAVPVALGACQGKIGGGGRDPGTGWDPAGVVGVDPAGATRALDEAMRARDPDLFDTALKYFPGEAPGGGPARLARLTRVQLDETLYSLLPDFAGVPLVQAMPRDPLQTNYEYSDNLRFNPANFVPYTDWAAAVAAEVAEAPTAVVTCDNQDTGCLDQGARDFVTRAFRGVTYPGQLDRYAGFYTASVAEMGHGRATADLVELALTSPAFVFRDEVRTDTASMLLPAHWLQHMTYTLADVPPVVAGLDHARASELQASEQSQSQAIAQVLGSPQARDKLQRFFIAWLEVREPEGLDISPVVFPEFGPELAAAVVADAKAFLAHQLAVAAPVLKDITQSNEGFVSQAQAAIYGGPPSVGTLPVARDGNQRMGIFTEPAVIASHSGPTTTRLVKRGVFFTRKIMCIPLGVPPEDVDTTVPEQAGATERERIEEVTSAPRCQGCHAYINPFGFMQENYDPIGRYRTTDQGKPVDASMTTNVLDEGPFSADAPVEALRHLTSSLRFQQCFTRQLFRFYMGRDERTEDDPVLRRMFFEFAEGDRQDIVGMLRTLAGSTSFSQRVEVP